MCLNPILIPNPKYQHKTRGPILASVMPFYDRFRLYFPVPCGHCSECMKKRRQDWYIRLRSEYAVSPNCYFVTFTLNPASHKVFGQNPRRLIRHISNILYNDHRVDGKRRAYKRLFVCEYGKDTGRLHVHGLIFAEHLDYNHFHELFRELGFTWIEKVRSTRGISYCLKYVSKTFEAKRYVNDHFDHYEEIVNPRMYVSPGIGKECIQYGKSLKWSSSLVVFPGFDKDGNAVNYKYAIPRYYFRNLPEFDRLRRWFKSFIGHVSADQVKDGVFVSLLEGCSSYFKIPLPKVFPNRSSIDYRARARYLDASLFDRCVDRFREICESMVADDHFTQKHKPLTFKQLSFNYG